MPKTTLKEVVQDGLPILADIIDVHILWSHSDVEMFLQRGAVLLAVAKVEDRDGLGPFRFCLGWPRAAGERPALWRTYGQEPDLG